jgi:hypothetical protein
MLPFLFAIWRNGVYICSGTVKIFPYLPIHYNNSMPAPDTILQLVDQFASQLASYRSLEYNEAQARREFIEPFFDVLGWDIYNKQGYAYSYKDVIFEDAIKVGGATKAPDYAFRIGGTRKFFVEAKKPSVNVKDEITPAYQLRRYAWSAKLPLSILTDFEEFAVYDCRAKPDKTDKASTGRIMLLTYRDYPSHWDEIAGVFSHQAVLKGSFDKYAEAVTGKRGTAEVDDAFLAEIERWRELLVHNIALRNPALSQRDLNYAVQMTIDRLIFLRICEDRGIEFYGQLQSLFNGGETYPRLCQLFRKADDRYNSGLFHFLPERDQTDAPDLLTPGLLLDDKPLKDILANLYYPDSPYEFSVLPADILGQVYERFLGKVIRLTAGHHAVVEDKPEVKKAGGVFYTPTFIVEYIVKNTLGKLLEGKAPGQVGLGRGTPIRVLDMSCGSGSFLLGAYQYLLDWYLSGYSGEPEKWSRGAAPKLYQVSSPDGALWKLTTSERKRILLDHIYGVDIDPQAVEVTKLSLLLKVLEGESQESIGKQLSMFRQRALPDLAGNIKCGNSLIGPDFYTHQPHSQGALPGFDMEEQYRINAFDWQREFTTVFTSSGGFDVIIGNPPWGASYNNAEKEYFRKKYDIVHIRTPESFNYFIAHMWELTKRQGLVGTIIPSSFLSQHEFWKTRKFLVETSVIFRICNLGDGVFNKVTAPSCIVIFTGKSGGRVPIFLDLRKIDRRDLPASLNQEYGAREASHIGKESESFSLLLSVDNLIIQKCYRWPTLREQAEDVATGVSSGLDTAYVYKPEDAQRLRLESNLLRKLVIGGEIHRYVLTPTSGKQLIYVTPEVKIEDYPKCYAALLPYREQLKKRREAANGQIPWFSLNWPRRKKLFDEPKILIRQTANRILAAFDTEGWYCLKSGIIIQIPKEAKIKYEYLLGILNSRLMHFLYDDLVGEQTRVFPEVKPVQLFRLPIRTINFADPTDVQHHDQMVALVERMLSLHQQLISSNTPNEKTLLQRQIDTTDRQIDGLVYELYGLIEEEIRLVHHS